MIRLKKLTALLVSAALALSLLAGCGGSKALSQVIADLLSGQYNNVTVEVDPDLTAALKKAAAAGDTQEEVLAALVENLNLSGGSITFNNLGDGQQGQHGVTLTFQAGSDPDAAARSAFTEWNRVFSSLPDDGSYRAHVSMIEAENGYYIAVDVEVLKAGTPDKDDGDDDKDDDNGEDGGDDTTAYTQDKDENGDITKVTIKAKNGLQQLVDDLKEESEDPATALAAADITLNCDVTLNDTWIPIGTEQNPYTGTFDGGDCTISGLSVNSAGQAGLFGCVGQGGTVKNLTLVSPAITGSSYAGAVAGVGRGAIENCHVTGSGNISSSYSAGGVVGNNNGGTVTACSSTGDVTATGSDGRAGGVVGANEISGKVIACYATGNVTATGSDGRAGGVVGFNSSSGSVTVCYHANGAVKGTGAGGVVGSNANTITACYATGDVTGNTYAGGVVGYNGGTVTACYSTGTVNGSTAGGVVGINVNTVTACYWSGSVDGNKGIGDDDTTPTGEATKVRTPEEWEQALTALNKEANKSGYTFGGYMNSPTLKKN